MHPADIRAAISKKGGSMAELARTHGYSEAYVRNALIRPLFQAEQIIAKFIGIPAHILWPLRYDKNGRRRVLPASTSARATKKARG